MQFANDSGLIVKKLLPFFLTCKPKHIKQSRYKNSLNKIYEHIYDDIVNGEKYYNSIVPIKAKVHVKDKIKRPELLNHYFVPHTIRNYIEEQGLQQLEYRFNVGQREINVRIMLFNKDDLMNLHKYEEYISFVCIWLHICGQYSTNKCSKTLSIYLYPTPLKKVLPARKTEVISVENVNTALTTRCKHNGEIIIYRQEEWMKVFIHETFHTFGLDVDAHFDTAMNNMLLSEFSVNSNFSVSEAYTETWARIMNAAFSSYRSMKVKDEGRKEFMLYLDFSLQIERMYSLVQLNKILMFMDMNYLVFMKSRNQNIKKNSKIQQLMLYKEDPNTNVFGYYILTGLLMNCYYDFLIWCSSTNLSLFKFSGTRENSGKFVDLIKKCRDLEQCGIPKGVIETGSHERFFRTTTRMSAIEVSY
tara:strand:+ start:2613 stop:3860 length:1248 start_codon:yes stop_codon:yes gene_type:complete